MVAAVRVHKHGGPEVLTLDDIEVPAPGQGQIKIKQYASGVNFIDTYFRVGMYPSPVGMPFVSGNEGAGEVTAVGPGVTDVKVGDRVAYVVPLGGYSAERLLPAERAVKLLQRKKLITRKADTADSRSSGIDSLFDAKAFELLQGNPG